MLCVGLTVYSETVKPIEIIENVKRALEEMMQSSTSDVQNITTIDVTGIELGKETEHEHVYKTMYDEEKHWEECIICNEKRNEVVHSFTTTWAAGSESCNWNNSYTKTCTCGYSETRHKPCVWDGSSYLNTTEITHNKICKVCKDRIHYLYYLNSYGIGQLYDATNNGKNEAGGEICSLSNGTQITCKSAGTCSKCKKVWSYNHKLFADIVTEKVYCRICGEEFGTITSEITQDFNVPATYTISSNVKLINGAKYVGIFDTNQMKYDGSGNSTTNITNLNSDNTEFTMTVVGKFSSTFKVKTNNIGAALNGTVNGVSCRISIATLEKIFSPDSVEPVILNIDNEENELIEWNKSKSIVISGTENYCNTVKVKILDDENNEVFSGETTVTNGNYSISCTPDVEAGLEGRMFKAIVTDACENSTEQEFTISKIDAISPEATSNAEVNEEWAKEKSFTAAASDQGIGNVQIAFNDVADYQLATKNGTEYTRDYKLTGDVYSPTKARVFYKDELNNISSQEITIDKLDNTAPTITGSSLNNNKLAIEANDIKEGMGEGSGVAKYRFVTSDTKYENPVVSKADSTEVLVSEDMIIPNISEVKYVYVVAEDAVGNVSSVYEAEVPQLNLRTEVNLSAANGKGGVDLDWSGYDPANKVFKAYQKKEGAEEFESISTVDFYKEIEPIKVLNVYPLYSYSHVKIPPVVTFRYLDGTSASLPKSAALKVWMEGGTMTEGSTTTTFEAYGKNPYTGQKIINVTPMSSTEFNSNPERIWNYDVVMFGTWDWGGGINDAPNDNAIKIIEEYIKAGYGILAGHDTIIYHSDNPQLGILRKLKKYFNIEIGHTPWQSITSDLNEIDYNAEWVYFSSKVKVEKQGLLTNFPYNIPIGAELTIPSTHTLSQAALGNVWMTLVNGRDGDGNIKQSINNYEGEGNPTYYLTTWNNTAMIQTGHSNGESTEDERKVLANTLFYLKQRTTETAVTDNSAQDLKAPNAPTVSAAREGSKIKLTHNATDNGNEYKYYVEAYDIADQSILLSKSNERIETVTTGTKGYYYIIDDNSNYVEFDTKDATYVEGESSLINLSNNGKYIHMKAVDVAGNISQETTIKLEVEIPELVLTSKVNLTGANGKGTIELDWSTFELEDVYYVVYRKEKNATEWTKIVSLEDKLTAKTYTDNLGNDRAKPIVPTINIVGNSGTNSIDLNLAATDTGTNYVYYVESYDAITGTLLKSSK